MKARGIDSETLLIMPGNLAPAPVCFTDAGVDESAVAIWTPDDAEGMARLRDRIANDPTTWANGPFDWGVLAQHCDMMEAIFHGLDAGNMHDVQSREKLLDIAKGRFRFKEDEETGEMRPIGYSLDAIAKRRHVGAKVFDQWRLRYGRLRKTPIEKWPEEARTYACMDALITAKVHEAQRLEGERDEHGYLSGSLSVEADAVRGHWALHLMSSWGFMTDPERVADLHRACKREHAELFPKLIDNGLVREDFSRIIKAVKARVLAAYGELDVPITATGQERMRGIDKDGERIMPWTKQRAIEHGYIATGKDVCWETDDPVLHDYARYSQLTNLLNKDVPHLQRGTILPIQAGYQPIMETFRTSSTGFNIQNLRREPGVRESFKPREGCVLAACDFDTAELVSFAQVCYRLFGFSEMREAILRGEDLHVRAGSNLLGMPYEEAMRKRKAGDPHVNAIRQLSKAANFGFLGGMGSRRFTGYAANYLRGTDLTVDEAESARLKHLWTGWWPETKLYFEWVRQQQDDETGLYYAVHPVTGRARGGMFYTACANNTFQELTAFGAKAAAYDVARAQHIKPDSLLYGTKTLAFIHDELILEMPEDELLTKRCRELVRVMCKAYNRYTPDVPVSAEATAMRVWSKDAKARHDAAGNIIIWEPKEEAA